MGGGRGRPDHAGDRRPAGQAGHATATSTVPFEIDDYTRWRLLEGLDDVGLTERNLPDIEAFEAQPAVVAAEGPAGRLSRSAGASGSGSRSR